MIFNSIMAAFMIAIGCIANLTAMPSPIGAFLFPVGLLVICGRGYKLATGLVWRLGDGSIQWREFVCVLCANVLSVSLFGMFGQFFEVGEAAAIIVESIGKLSMMAVFVRAVACGLLMTEAVMGWQRGSWITTYMCVAVFVFCGFRHCIADAFYISAVADAWVTQLPKWGVIVLGNIVGGLIPVLNFQTSGKSI